MSKILFTHSYFYKLDSKQWKFKQPYPPLGTIFAASMMRTQGMEVALFDTNLKDSPSEIKLNLEREKPDYLVIYDDGFNYLTKMCLTNMREAAWELARLGKESGSTIIVCSSDSSDHFDEYLDHQADYIIIGEGESTLMELINLLESGKTEVENIQGLAFRKEGETILTEKRPVINQLDVLPLPAWDLIDMDTYREIWQKHHGYFSLNIATTRGCPFKCNWCAKPIYGNRYNTRSPQNVLKEITHLLQTYQPDHFWMCDDIFGLKPGWVQEFRDLVKERSLQFKYKIQSRVDLLLQEDTIDALAQSGLETVWVGAESGSQKILDAMDKGTKVEQIYQATKLFKEKGIRVAFFLQFGYLGEGREDIDSTIQMVLDLMPDEIGISVSYPLPGTKFYEKVKTQLRDKANWSDSDDLDMMFNGTFQPAYYKKLHRFVHSLYQRQKGFQSWQNLLSHPLQVDRKHVKSVLATGYYIPASIIQGYQLKRLQTATTS